MQIGRFTAICTSHGRTLEHERAPVSGWGTAVIDIDLSWSSCPGMDDETGVAGQEDCSNNWVVVAID